MAAQQAAKHVAPARDPGMDESFGGIHPSLARPPLEAAEAVRFLLLEPVRRKPA
jgi:hypothetical protein